MCRDHCGCAKLTPGCRRERRTNAHSPDAPENDRHGDTIAVEGLDSTLRLLAIDTEETFKKDKERRLFEEGWDGYMDKRRRNSGRPPKAPTPLGEEAKEFAKAFFERPLVKEVVSRTQELMA